MENSNQRIVSPEPKKRGANGWGSVADQIQIGIENANQFVAPQPQKYIQIVDKESFLSLRNESAVTNQIEPDIQQAIDESLKEMELQGILDQIREMEENSFIQSSSYDPQ
ncbi:hypothetical protein HDV01_005157, partial [Terramyces sp. JEL0728]